MALRVQWKHFGAKCQALRGFTRQESLEVIQGAGHYDAQEGKLVNGYDEMLLSFSMKPK